MQGKPRKTRLNPSKFVAFFEHLGLLQADQLASEKAEVFFAISLVLPESTRKLETRCDLFGVCSLATVEERLYPIIVLPVPCANRLQ